MRRVRPVMWLYLTLLLSVGHAQAADLSLAPAAEKAFKRGMHAVQRERWDEAVQAFADAQHLASNAPPILYNLGLAHAKAGHPLLATAWLEAYLAASPQAMNADAVRAQVRQLLAVAQSSIELLVGQILQEALAAAQQIAGEDSRARALAQVSEAMAACGRVDAAMETITPAMRTWWGDQVATHLASEASLLWSDYASILAATGNRDAAQQLLMANVTEARHQDKVWSAIYRYELRERRDLARARQAAEHIQDPDQHHNQLAELEEAERRRRDAAQLHRASAVLSGAPPMESASAVSAPRSLQASDVILLAQEMSQELRLVSPAQALQRIAQQGGVAETMPESIANVADTLASYLLRVRTIARQLGIAAQVAASP